MWALYVRALSGTYMWTKFFFLKKNNESAEFRLYFYGSYKKVDRGFVGHSRVVGGTRVWSNLCNAKNSRLVLHSLESKILYIDVLFVSNTEITSI